VRFAGRVASRRSAAGVSPAGVRIGTRASTPSSGARPRARIEAQERRCKVDGGDETRGVDPRSPHWFDFNRVNETPSEWSFEVPREWDGDPDADGIDDRGEAEVVRGDHRFVVTTWLQPRERTHDRYWGVAYETVNQDGEAEPLSFHISTSQSIARNNLGHARDVLDSGETESHTSLFEITSTARVRPSNTPRNTWPRKRPIYNSS